MPRDWMNFFVPEDITIPGVTGTGTPKEKIAEQVNRLLREELERAPTVKFPSMEDEWCEDSEGRLNQSYGWQKKARLVDIREIKP